MSVFFAIFGYREIDSVEEMNRKNTKNKIENRNRPQLCSAKAYALASESVALMMLTLLCM